MAINKLRIENKTENLGVNSQGRLSANEFNTLKDKVNELIDAVNDGSSLLDNEASARESDIEAVRYSVSEVSNALEEKAEELASNIAKVDLEKIGSCGKVRGRLPKNHRAAIQIERDVPNTSQFRAKSLGF